MWHVSSKGPVGLLPGGGPQLGSLVLPVGPRLRVPVGRFPLLALQLFEQTAENRRR